ncbi:hypothetical protein [Agreia bicolorata]|uniref:hypothetical protein n=1 Tax=Agreia bicolorata TaxID=110935 RepID=UPI00111695D2|nr:hypothetical protein [Agreia bicolorata]
MATDSWVGFDTHSRQLANILAVDSTHRHPVFGHVSAAAIWGLPLADRAWPAEVHVIAGQSSYARSKNGVVVHRQQVDDGDVVERNGVLVTSLERTTIDLARTMPFPVAVAAIDLTLYEKRAGRHVLAREQLIEALLRSPRTNGRARARRAIDAARVGADNAGETLSRLAIIKLGFPEPLLQVQHVNPRGGFYYTDHEWPEYNAIAEFDGFGKYLKQALKLGERAGDVIYEEKIREDHLRDENNDVTRWGPPELRNPPEIARRLLRIGVPRITGR